MYFRHLTQINTACFWKRQFSNQIFEYLSRIIQTVLNPEEPILENLKAKQETQLGEVVRAQKEAISIEAYAQ